MCRPHCFNAWPQRDMEQRTSLLMDWVFGGARNCLGGHRKMMKNDHDQGFPEVQPENVTIFIHIFMCFNYLILNSLLNSCMMKS